MKKILFLFAMLTGAGGMVGRFGPSAWQLAVSGNWDALDRDFGEVPRAEPSERRNGFAGSSGLRPDKR